MIGDSLLDSPGMEDGDEQISKLSINDLLRGDDDSEYSMEEGETFKKEDPGSDWEDDNDDPQSHEDPRTTRSPTEIEEERDFEAE